MQPDPGVWKNATEYFIKYLTWKSPLYLFKFSVINITAANAHNVCVDCRKKKWRNKGSCTNSPDFIIVALQRWSCKWSVPAKVVLLSVFGRHFFACKDSVYPCQVHDFVFFHVGETGPMVTTTLKLGISILNGGNSEVQRVCVQKKNNNKKD